MSLSHLSPYYDRQPYLCVHLSAHFDLQEFMPTSCGVPSTMLGATGTKIGTADLNL